MNWMLVIVLAVIFFQIIVLHLSAKWFEYKGYDGFALFLMLAAYIIPPCSSAYLFYPYSVRL